MSKTPLWTPSQKLIEQSHLTSFAEFVGFKQQDYRALHNWSIEERADFWSSLWSYCNVQGVRGETIVEQADDFMQSRWFPQASLNFAENLLRYRDDQTAIAEINESGNRKTCSYSELFEKTQQFATFLKSKGIQQGDRVVGWLPNVLETVVAMLGTTSIGAIWSSCSPDFGIEGALDRFGQIEPKLLVACKRYYYNGKVFSVEDNVNQVVDSIPSIQTVVWYDPDAEDDFEAIYSRRVGEQYFARLPFDHPVYVMYSSGTTGKPKCIVHGAGGTLLQHLKEHQLHVDIKREDTLFFFTTTGWMMWNWLVSALASGCKIVLYDGAPFYPNPDSMLEHIDREQISIFGVGAKYISSLEKSNVIPNKRFSLDSLNSILSTGSPLSHESFQYVYRHFKQDVWLASISGGTDLISCFVLGNPWSPVFEGEIQGPGLAMAVNVYDGEGNGLVDERGELVCELSFPSKPIGFWKDENNTLYSKAYFESHPNIWAHGDFAEIDAETGGYIIHGRSDAVLNPGGVRIGTAEIYRQVETISSIRDAVCVAQEWEDDTRIILFVVMQANEVFSPNIEETIKRRIRSHASPRHVPAKVIPVADIPMTRSGKLAEIAVRETIHGREVKNTTALANPESLAEFLDLESLRS